VTDGQAVRRDAATPGNQDWNALQNVHWRIDREREGTKSEHGSHKGSMDEILYCVPRKRLLALPVVVGQLVQQDYTADRHFPATDRHQCSALHKLKHLKCRAEGVRGRTTQSKSPVSVLSAEMRWGCSLKSQLWSALDDLSDLDLKIHSGIDG